jgi:transcriptional regulator with XRE-family HTH domain
VVEDLPGGTGGHAEILEIKELGRLVRERRQSHRQSVRQAAQEAGVSFATLARVEDGSQPDLVTFMKLCAWLGRPPSSFFRPVTERPVGHLERALDLLAADPRLTPEATHRLSSLVRDLYDAYAAAPSPTTPVMDVHLRATQVMRPGVPERLAELLADMRTALAQRIADGNL